MQSELLTTDELSPRIKYDVRTIRERLKDSVPLEGIHYIRPFGGRKICRPTVRMDAKLPSTGPRRRLGGHSG